MLAEATDTAAEITADPYHSMWKRRAGELRDEARRYEDEARQARKLADAMRSHPSYQGCETPLSEPCECDEGSHIPPSTRGGEQPREHSIPCRGIHDMKARPQTWNTSGLCDGCLNKRPKAWRPLWERELIDRARDLSESMDDAS
jgi:hypothetical protein